MHWDQKQELWLPVKDYEGLYEVSNFGRVKSLERTRIGKGGGLYPVPERVLRPVKDIKGYLFVNLYKDGKLKAHKVHRLVAQAFLPNPLSLPQVNHKDCNPQNNRVENLEWCNCQYNIDYSQSKPILQFTRTGELVAEYPSTHEAHRVTGINQSNISACARGNKWYSHAGGFVWRYKG